MRRVTASDPVPFLREWITWGAGPRASQFLVLGAKAHAAIKNVDTIITGHSTLMMWSDLAEYAQFNKDFLRDVRAAAAAGQGADAVAGTWKAPDKYKGYTIQEARLKTNVQSLYRELGK